MKTRTRRSFSATKALALFAAAGMAAVPGAALGNPDDPNVVHGTAQFDVNGNYMTITTSHTAIIDYSSFNIGSGETVQFVQPGADSRVLNRINGANPTSINGNLLANGHVYIVNPSGVIFGQNAVVNVGHMFAAAANISNSDFLAGRNNFTSTGGRVENYGTLRGDVIALVGSQVANHGNIQAGEGTVIMAAGDKVMIGERLGHMTVRVERADGTPYEGGTGVNMASGDIYSLAAFNGGTIQGNRIHVASTGTTRVGGTIDATGPNGGSLMTSGDQVQITNSMNLNGGVLSAKGNSVEIANLDQNGRRLKIQAGVVDLLGVNGGKINVGGQITTTRTLGDLDAVELTALTAETENALLADPSMGDLSLLATGGELCFSASRYRTLNGGGVQLTNSSTLWLSPDSTWVLDGRFRQNGSGNVVLGSDISTTGDNIAFWSAVVLSDDVMLRAFDGTTATPTISFGQTIDSCPDTNFFLGADAGYGDVFVGGGIGQTQQLKNLRFRGSTVEVGGNVSTQWFQQYITDNAIFRGDLLETTETGSVLGLESAQIEIIGDDGLGFGGNMSLVNDLTIRTAGVAAGDRPSGIGDDFRIDGRIDSESGERNDLTIDAGNALAIFGGLVGGGVGTGNELGYLNVTAAEAKLFDSVYTNGMEFHAPVEINGADTTLHTGDGVAWFGGNLYSAAGACNDVAFLFSGEPYAATGEARVPFKFTSDIGADSAGSAGRQFGNVRFGDDVAGNLEMASFLFADGATPGLSLVDASTFNSGDAFSVFACESIETGRGQKLTSFGDLSLLTSGNPGSTVAFSDVNVLGDFLARADSIVFKARRAGAIEGVSTEQDRINGDPVNLLTDFAMEVITSGSQTFDGTLSVDAPAGLEGALVLFQEGHTVSAWNATRQTIEAIGSVDTSLFESLSSDGELMPYDLRLTLSSNPSPNRGLSIFNDARLDNRFPGRYTPELAILHELGLNPRAIDDDDLRRALEEGRLMLAHESRVNISDDHTLTVDRLSRPTERRLNQAYTALLGERIVPDQFGRQYTDDVQMTLGEAWLAYLAGGNSDSAGFRQWIADNHADADNIMCCAEWVMAELEGLELPDYERSIARGNFLELIRPEEIDSDSFDDLFRSIEQFDPAEAEIKAIALRKGADSRL